jgi:gluconokinase
MIFLAGWSVPFFIFAGGSFSTHWKGLAFIQTMQPKFVIVMGVSGSGKTALGGRLAAALGWDFYDADDYHSSANVAKMGQGIPLTDEDRAEWLARLRALLAGCLVNNSPAVLACSVLKESYRQVLMQGDERVKLVYLRGSYELIFARMNSRGGHFMKAEMLKSQFDILEEPEDALVVDISLEMDEIITQLVDALRE